MRRSSLAAVLPLLLVAAMIEAGLASEAPGEGGGTVEEVRRPESGAPAAAPGADMGPASSRGEPSDEPPRDAGGEPEAAPPSVSDPIEPVNRALFVVNDKAYFWVMKPVAQVYRGIVPEAVRLSVRNFFLNLGTPIRFANNLLQGNIKGSGVEVLRFAINSTIGFGGLFDVARNDFHLERRNEDLGLTLGTYGVGQGFYLVLPLLGPSTLRDAAGLVGDSFADPVNYAGDFATVLAVKTYKAENEVSLSIGEYEDLKKASLDPYVAVRDAYIQYRAKRLAK